MGIEWFRDLAVCILGFGVAIVAIFIGVLALLIYLKLRPILDSVKATTKTVENISSSVAEEVARPLARVAGFIQGIRQAASLFGKSSRERRGEENG